jgi:redox-sensitive bicupin YhaK (pirin superfamily)
MTTWATTPRPVAAVIPAVRTVEGGGFVVRRPFPTPSLELVDPFLLLDEMGPVDYAPGEAIGAPDHPHRGFETVTYVLDGEMEHRDSAGNHGVIGPGDVQWMTAGAGIVHSEMPSELLRRRGGRVHGFQIWVNLPRADKMAAPRYQGVTAAEIPTTTADDGRVTVRVVSGTAAGLTGAATTHSPVTYLHVTLHPGGRFEQPVPDGHTALAYVFGGAVDGAHDGDLVEYERSSGPVVLHSDGGAEALVLTGAPLNEPVARYGPFVMNSRAEILQAFEDYQAGRMGAIVATGTGVSRDEAIPSAG